MTATRPPSPSTTASSCLPWGSAFQTPSDVTQAAVEDALRVGYRLIDITE